MIVDMALSSGLCSQRLRTTQRATYFDARHPHQRSIFGDRSARDAQSLLGEKRRELRIRERPRRIFSRDQLFQERAYGGGRTRSARFGRKLPREEVLELVH